MRQQLDHRTLVAIFLLVFGVYALNAGGHAYSIDEERYFLVSEAATHGRLDIEVRRDRPAVLTVAGRDGKTAAVGNIGAALLGAPLLAAARGLEGSVDPDQRSFFERLFVDWTNSITGALTACVLYLITRRLGASPRLATALALVLAFCTYFMPHSKSFFTEPTAALFVAMTFLLGIRARQRDAGNWPFVLVGLAAGAAINVRTSVAALVGVSLAASLVACARTATPRRVLERVAAAAAGLAPGVAFLLWSQWLRFGDAFNWGYPSQDFDVPFYEGLYGQFLSPGKALIFFAPVVVLAALLFPRFLRHHTAVAVEVAVIVLVNALIFSTFENWGGGNAFGPRFMVIVLPIALVPLVELTARGAFRWAFGVLAVLGLVVPSLLGNLTYFNTGESRYYTERVEDAGLTATAERRPLTAEELRRVNRLAWFEPRHAQLVLQARTAPDAIRNTWKTLTDAGFRRSIAVPSTERERLYWFASVPVLDVWPVWILLWGGPKWLYLFAVAFLACAVTGFVVLVRAIIDPRTERRAYGIS